MCVLFSIVMPINCSLPMNLRKKFLNLANFYAHESNDQGHIVFSCLFVCLVVCLSVCQL